MIFILGIERSATTWVANILDHHPKTDVFIEPLSQFNSRFNQWPDRFTKLENIKHMAGYFFVEIDSLKKHRRFLLTRFADAPFAWRTDLSLAQFLTQKQLATSSTKDFLELNFHRKGLENTISKLPPFQMVVKELRLNFNAELIYQIEKKAKALVVIREPASCIRSILNQIEKGNLVELKSSLKKHYSKITPQTVCKYWIESYSALIGTLQEQPIPYKIVSHTSLLKKTNIVVDGLFHFLDLSLTAEVKRFLQLSNQTGSGKHSTKRNRKNLLIQMKEDRDIIYPKIKQELQQIRSHPILKQFVEET